MKKWGLILILILVAIIIIQYATRPEKREPWTPVYLPKRETNIKQVYKPEVKQVTRKPYRVVYHDTIVDSIFIPANIDTNAILMAYFEKAIYEDTLQSDSTAFIFIRDTITQNRISSRKKIIRIRPFTVHEPTRKVYAGIGVGGNMNQFSFAGKLLYVDRRERIYGISYYPMDKILELSVFWKISLKRNKRAN